MTTSGGLRCDGCDAPLPRSRGPRRRRWCSERCRKVTLYAGSCVDCGAPTNGYGGPGRASKRCCDCDARRRHEMRIWTPETVVEAIRAFADRYGRQPADADWNVGMGTPEQRERYWRDACWPSPSTVRRECGSWSAALRAAGFEPLLGGPATPFRDDPRLVDDVVAAYRAGESGYSLAARYGVSDNTIYGLLRRAGVARRTLSEAQRLRMAAP